LVTPQGPPKCARRGHQGALPGVAGLATALTDSPEAACGRRAHVAARRHADFPRRLAVFLQEGGGGGFDDYGGELSLHELHFSDATLDTTVLVT
jgi:hypothetical protein